MTQTKSPPKMRQYEGMFLFDPTFGAAYESCEGEIKRIMDRAGAEIVVCRKWDERRLAFKIKGRKRGVYVLAYFTAPPERIGGIERDVKLSEHLLRVLILDAEGMTREHMERAFETRSEEGRPGGDRDEYADRPPRRRPRDEQSTAAAPVGRDYSDS
jgi:small subunit ribosomal protein S6